MRCLVIETFKRRGELQTPGSIIDVPDDALVKLAGYVRPIATAGSYTPADWRPEFKAWLTPDGELRTTGVCDDLAGEIIKLTGGNMQLQAKLLLECCEVYSGTHWIHTIRRWRERACHLYEAEGMELHPANYQAATEMRLLAFAEELKLKPPEHTGNQATEGTGTQIWRSNLRFKTFSLIGAGVSLAPLLYEE